MDVLNVVYLDDDGDDHLFLREALHGVESASINLTSLYNGSQLIEYLFRAGVYNKCQDPLPDLILLDINMPVMNGITVLRTLKSIPEFQHIPVFILSTAKEQSTFKECEEIGATGCYTKSLQIGGLTPYSKKHPGENHSASPIKKDLLRSSLLFRQKLKRILSLIN
jgi:CheY-like chemotaxis protein